MYHENWAKVKKWNFSYVKLLENKGIYIFKNSKVQSRELNNFLFKKKI